MKEKVPLPRIDTVPGWRHGVKGAEQGGFQSPACTTVCSGRLCHAPSKTTEQGLSPTASDSEVLSLAAV